MKKAPVKKMDAEETPPLCFNCDAIMKKPDLFCKRLCTDEAHFVRSMRRWISQGRGKGPDIIETSQILMAHILNGGYPRKERELPHAVRQAVKDRAKAMCETPRCRNPGAEIDHIRGSSPDLSNLQYLCRDCHMKKTKAGLKPITPDHPKYQEYIARISVLVRRYTAKKPLRPCDDHETWNESWKAYQQERKLWFAKDTPKLESEEATQG